MIKTALSVPILDEQEFIRLDQDLLNSLNNKKFVKYCELLRLKIMYQRQLALAEQFNVNKSGHNIL